MESEEISCNFKEPTDSNIAISFNYLTLSWEMQVNEYVEICS